MKWIKMQEKLPPKDENAVYSQIPCLVIYDRAIKILMFNHTDECWDGSDGDDYFCDIYKITHWMPLPDMPK